MKLPWVLFLFWEFWLRRPMIGGCKPWLNFLCVHFLAQTNIRSLMKFLIGQYGFLHEFCNHVDSSNIFLVVCVDRLAAARPPIAITLTHFSEEWGGMSYLGYVTGIWVNFKEITKGKWSRHQSLGFYKVWLVTWLYLILLPIPD